MTPSTDSPTDRASFDSAMAIVLSEHTTLRRLATTALERSNLSADAAMSLADAMTAHERIEARLFALPFLTNPPKAVTATSTRAHQYCKDYVAGTFRRPDANAAAALFVDALLTHLEAEEAWLTYEKEQHHERLLRSI